MAALAGYQWRRDKDGLGVWEHRGKVAVAVSDIRRPISEMVGMAAQAVGDGMCHTCLVICLIFPHSTEREGSDTHCRVI